MIRKYNLFSILLLVLFSLSSCSSEKNIVETSAPGEKSWSEVLNNIKSENCEETRGGPPYSYDCYYNKAVLLEDSNYCDSTEDTDSAGAIKTSCLEATKDCEVVDNKDQCYLQKIQASSNALVTGAVQGFPNAAPYLSEQYASSYCDKINDEATRMLCYTQLSNILYYAPLCERISSEPAYVGYFQISRGTCYLQLSKENNYKDLSICEKIKPEEGQEICIMNVIKSKIGCLDNISFSYEEVDKTTSDNIQLSSEISSIGTRCKHYSYFYTNEGDTYLNIPEINDAEKKAVANLDEKYCEEIRTDISRSGCYVILAVLKKDPALCDLTTVDLLRNTCLEVVPLIDKN